MIFNLEQYLKYLEKIKFFSALDEKKKLNKFETKKKVNKTQLSLSDDYRINLIEKQKLCNNYYISEKQLKNYYIKSKLNKKCTGLIFLQNLEFRLDCIIYRLGFFNTIPKSRQMITHGHILINNKKVTFPSFQCKLYDIIQIKNINLLNKIKNYNQKLPSHLKFNKNNFSGKIISLLNKKDILIKINELKIIQYYSR